MHILIGAITAFAGLIWALNSLQNSGFDLNTLNPFTWARRRKWEKLYGTKPIHNLTHPIEAAAVLIVGALKQEGEISREQKAVVIEIFENEFKLSKSKAVEAFCASVHMVKDEINFDESLKSILAPCKSHFSPEQAESLISILQNVTSIEGGATEVQSQIITGVKTELEQDERRSSTWN